MTKAEVLEAKKCTSPNIPCNKCIYESGDDCTLLDEKKCYTIEIDKVEVKAEEKPKPKPKKKAVKKEKEVKVEDK